MLRSVSGAQCSCCEAASWGHRCTCHRCMAKTGEAVTEYDYYSIFDSSYGVFLLF